MGSPLSCTAFHVRGPRKWRRVYAMMVSRHSPTMPGSRVKCGGRRKTSSSRMRCPSSWPPSPSAWASTSPTSALVVHYDLPKSLESYYQETGRAGRDGLSSDCVLFYTYGDKVKQEYFIDQIEDEIERRRSRDKLAKVVGFCESQSCRRSYLLRYFGEAWEQEDCQACDVCLTPREEFDATEIAQKILSAVVRTGERFGAGHVIRVLRGSGAKRIKELGHDRLSVYGIVDDFPEVELIEVSRQLVTRGLLFNNGRDYPTLGITPGGWKFLKKREKLTLSKPRSREGPDGFPGPGDSGVRPHPLRAAARTARPDCHPAGRAALCRIQRRDAPADGAVDSPEPRDPVTHFRRGLRETGTVGR